jgi:hypothetical protein
MFETIKSKETSQINVDNMNNIRCKASRHSRNKKKEYLKELMTLHVIVRTKTLQTCMED